MEAERGVEIISVPDYVVGERLGAGGFGEVFRARHAVIGRDVAIKVLHARYSGDPAAVARFVAEARAANQISHPGIVEIFDFGALADRRQFYVMELLSGRTLREVLAREALVRRPRRHRDRRGVRHAALHVARAVPRQERRHPHRSLRVRLPRLPRAHRRPPVHGRAAPRRARPSRACPRAPTPP